MRNEHDGTLTIVLQFCIQPAKKSPDIHPMEGIFSDSIRWKLFQIIAEYLL